MDFETIKGWLGRWVEREARSFRLKGFLGLALGPIALALALGILFGLLKILHRRYEPPRDTMQCVWITLGLLPLLFIGNKIFPRRNLMQERMEAGPGDAFGNYAAKRQVLPLIFLWIMFAGPRLFSWAWDSFGEAKRVKKMDVHSCAAVMWILISASKKVSFDDMLREMDWLDLNAIIPELRTIPGVLLLHGPPPGMTLNSEMRSSIIAEIKAGR